VREGLERAVLDTAVLEMIAFGGATMGTTWSVRAVCAPGTDAHVLHAAAQSALDRVVAQMSHWREDSDLARYNRAPAGSMVRLPDAFAEVMRCALDIAEASDGAFDPTLGALVDAWGFGPSASTRTVPDDATLAPLRANAGWHRLAFDETHCTLLQPGGVALDLSAIAKGYGADLVARALRARSVPAALVEVGGELVGYGRKPDGGRWRVLIEACAEDAAPVAAADAPPLRAVVLDGLAVATSGDRWHAFEHDGTRHAHTLDPRDGRARADAPVAVTVIADCAMRADAWATALTVMGVDAGLAFARAHDFAVRFLVRDGGRLREHLSPRFEALSEIAT
jgi:thiamine biosynthesis lipoprotein